MDLGLTDKKAIITGGSRGIGRAIAERLLDEGATVAISARNQEGLDATVADLAERAGDPGRVHGATVDVADEAALTGWVTSSAEAMGGLDIVISNASGGGAGRMGAEDFQRTLDIDILGLVRCVDAAMPHLEASESAAILAVSTTAALEHFMNGMGSYPVLKAGLINLIGGYAQSLGPKGVRANAVSPGPIFIEGGGWDHIKQNMAEFYEATIATQPTGRLGSPEEVANAVAFLVSPAASWVTGENLVIDGGYTKRIAF